MRNLFKRGKPLSNLAVIPFSTSNGESVGGTMSLLGKMDAKGIKAMREKTEEAARLLEATIKLQESQHKLEIAAMMASTQFEIEKSYAEIRLLSMRNESRKALLQAREEERRLKIMELAASLGVPAGDLGALLQKAEHAKREYEKHDFSFLDVEH